MSDNTVPLAVTVAGMYVMWFGVHYWRDSGTKWPSDPVKAVLTGKAIPAPARGKAPDKTVSWTDSPSSSSSTPSSSGSIPTSGSAQAIMQQVAGQFGWGSGSQWQSLQALEMGEAGFDPKAKNPSSGALGLAQALGHGKGAATAGTLSNQYGGYGLSDAEAKRANSGEAGPQALWMLNYIKSVYGDPNTAYAKWKSRSPHWY